RELRRTGPGAARDLAGICLHPRLHSDRPHPAGREVPGPRRKLADSRFRTSAARSALSLNSTVRAPRARAVASSRIVTLFPALVGTIVPANASAHGEGQAKQWRTCR